MPAKTRPINRFWDQIIRDRHLTFNKKWRELVMQTFGHEALINESDTADIAHCTVFDIDFYRLNTLTLKHLALRKLLNPFKWVEFLIVAPLELLSWKIHSLAPALVKASKKALKELPDKKSLKAKAISYSADFLFIVHSLVSAVINLAVNIVTGLARRLLAPVRYLIRPAIETAKKYPWSFATIAAITAAVAIGLTVTILTGGLPAVLGGLFLAGSLAVKLATVGVSAVALGAFLTKGFNTVREFFAGISSARHKPSGSKQMRGVDERNQQLDYKLRLIATDQDLTKTTLDLKHRDDLPLLIKTGSTISIYGRSPTGGTQLKTLNTSYSSAERIYTQLFSKNTLNETREIDAIEIPADVYEDINNVKGHITKKAGSTEKIAEAFHAIDIDHVELRMPEAQDSYYSAALFTGTESLFYPKKSRPPARIPVDHLDLRDLPDLPPDLSPDLSEDKPDSDSQSSNQP